MAKYSRQHKHSERFGKCQICLGYISIEYYFGIGDEIKCNECGTVYFIDSKNPVKFKMSDFYTRDDYFSDMLFED